MRSYRCLAIPSTMEALTPKSKTVVEHLAKGRGDHPLPLEENLGMFVTAVFNMPHFRVKQFLFEEM